MIPTTNSIFPDPNSADENGLIAIGGNLETATLIDAYSNGIFPWSVVDGRICWFSPDPRLILLPENIAISKSMKSLLKKNQFKITIDASFEKVITECRNIRLNEFGEGTWILPEFQNAYTELHKNGFAHSVEVWMNNEIVGGLYGVQIGKVFFGESMFSVQSNASKAALIFLCEHCIKNGIELIDCQQTTSHLVSMGAHEISRKEFLTLLNKLI
ncbi:leucyl/phenylalanyl-tRNA--protein transferase [Bacteroidota bacterium]|nr:leucyl/phenylalanyl-tRNA--protein transferase [Bacteroidota bacterium]